MLQRRRFSFPNCSAPRSRGAASSPRGSCATRRAMRAALGDLAGGRAERPLDLPPFRGIADFGQRREGAVRGGARPVSGKRSPGMIQSPQASAAARCRRFLSSRTLPGQEWASAASSASEPMPRMPAPRRLRGGGTALDQPGDVLGAVAERRDLHRQRVEPVEQVVAEAGLRRRRAAGRGWWRRRSWRGTRPAARRRPG